MSAPKTPEDLLAIESIKQLKSDYFYFLDTKAWDRWTDLFTPDLLVTGTITQGRNRGEFVESVRINLGNAITCHHGFNPMIRLVDTDHATGRWAMTDDIIWRDQEATRRLRGHGHYHEEYRSEDGRWRISSLRLTRLAVWSESNSNQSP